MGEPWLTVVTITRNDLVGLQATVASLYEQIGIHEVQHVVVDGASEDGSFSWVKHRLAGVNSSALSEPDTGIYDAMNKGLALARGQYVLYLNSGDVLQHPSVLRALKDRVSSRALAWGYGGAEVGTSEGLRRVLPREGRSTWWKLAYLRYEVAHPAVLMSTALLRDLGGFDARLRIAGDYKVVLQAARRHRAEVWPVLLARMAPGGLSVTQARRAHVEAHLVRRELLSLGPGLQLLDLTWTWARILLSESKGLRQRLRSPS